MKTRAEKLEYNRKYRREHKETLRKYQRKHYREHRAERLELQSRLHRINREHDNERTRKWRRDNREYLAEQEHQERLFRPEKIRAQGRVRMSIMRGRLVKPKECSACRKVGPIEGHHPDYTKPLEVVWLCADCHRIISQENRKGKGV